MSVDDGLRALARGDAATALLEWRAQPRDPEAVLFTAQLLLLQGEMHVMEEAQRLADLACELDATSPDAWILAGEIRMALAVTEGRRRVAGAGRLFRLEDMLREVGALDRVLHCYERAAMYDGGRLARVLARVCGMWKSSEYPERIMAHAGDAKGQATGPDPLDLLRRAGETVEPTPDASRLHEMIRKQRADRVFVALVLPPPSVYDREESLREAGLEAEWFTEAQSTEWLEAQVPSLASRGLALMGAPAIAYNEVRWERAGRSLFWWLECEALTLGECLGGLLRTRVRGAERAWCASRLIMSSATECKRR